MSDVEVECFQMMYMKQIIHEHYYLKLCFFLYDMPQMPFHR